MTATNVSTPTPTHHSIYASLVLSDPANIPQELQLPQYPFWLNWFPSQSSDKPDKILKRPLLGSSWQTRLLTFSLVNSVVSAATDTDSTTDSTTKDSGQHIGYGFAYTPDHPFICIDLDDLSSSNIQLAGILDSYTEVSPSKKGLHIIVAVPSVIDKQKIIKAFGNGQRNLANKRDLFIANGYVTMTGLLSSQILPTHPNKVRVLPTEDLIPVLASYFKLKDQDLTNATTATTPTDWATTSDIALTNQAPEKAYPPKYIKSLLDKVPVKQLPGDIFLRLSNNEPVILDPLCEEEAREPWLIIGQALHHHYKGGVPGYQLWDTWSSLGNKYSKDALDSVWQSFSATTVGRAITIASLIKLVDAQTTAYPDLDGKGRALGTLKNFRTYLSKTNIKIYVNELDKQVYFDIPKEKQIDWEIRQEYIGLDVLSEIILSEISNDKAASMAFSRTKIKNFLIGQASINTVNPIRDYFQSVGASWDGRDYLNSLMGTITVQHRPNIWAYKLFIRKWMIQVVAAACHKQDESVRLNRVLILTGAQGIGKTRWVESLFPPALKKYCAGDKELKLGKFKSESTKLAMELTSTLICNINEIDRLFSSTNFADFKAFLDQTSDNIVLPYGDRPVELTRRTVFIGSCNEENFLADTTGNRRFETIPLVHLNSEHTLDIDQLWGQVYNLYMHGERWWFDHTDPDDAKICQFRDQTNEQAMAIPLEFMYEELSAMFDLSAPIAQWRPLALADIRSLIGLTRTQGRESLPLNKIKQTLNAWRAQIPDAPAPYSASKNPRAAVLYPMPPLITLEDKFPTEAFRAAEHRDQPPRIQ